MNFVAMMFLLTLSRVTLSLVIHSSAVSLFFVVKVIFIVFFFHFSCKQHVVVAFLDA